MSNRNQVPCLSLFLEACSGRETLAKSFLNILVLLVFSQDTSAQLTESLRKRLAGARDIMVQVQTNEQVLSMIGSEIDINSRKRIILQKADERGNMIWSKTNPGESGSIADVHKSFWLDSKGNIFILGSSYMAGEYVDFIQKSTPDSTPV